MNDYTPPPPLGPPPPTVPEGWKAIWNEQYNAWYYINTQTKQTQWEKPTHPSYPAPPAGPPPPSYDAKPMAATNPKGGLSEVERLEKQLAEAKLQAAANTINRDVPTPQAPQAEGLQQPAYNVGQQPAYSQPYAVAPVSQYDQQQRTMSPPQPVYGQPEAPYNQAPASYGGAYPMASPPQPAPYAAQPYQTPPPPAAGPDSTRGGLFSRLSSKFGGSQNPSPAAGAGMMSPPPPPGPATPQQKKFGTGAMLGAGALALGGGALMTHMVHRHDEHLREEGYEEGREDYDDREGGGSTTIVYNNTYGENEDWDRDDDDDD